MEKQKGKDAELQKDERLRSSLLQRRIHTYRGDDHGRKREEPQGNRPGRFMEQGSHELTGRAQWRGGPGPKEYCKCIFLIYMICLI